MKKQLTQERLKSLLHYDPQTGHFTYLEAYKDHQAGDRAGYVKTNGYREVAIDGHKIYEHRLAVFYVTGAFPQECVDHVNRNPIDNRWANLREATYCQNSWNTGLRKDNTSGYKGVCPARNGLWQAYLYADGARLNLGFFEEKERAVEAVAAKRKELHGDFAYQATKQ
ncbi:HNH endonuclease [Paraburkholderia sp. IW21]|uniref:HNH endonuclease n=1 Tax=Paraburkholderia sp. IW21 TaxID=3242488 RepID=UPI0035214B3F